MVEGLLFEEYDVILVVLLWYSSKLRRLYQKERKFYKKRELRRSKIYELFLDFEFEQEFVEYDENVIFFQSEGEDEFELF